MESIKAPDTIGSRGNARGQRARQRLLEAALRSFATRGFYGTSTRDIAEAAGMSPAAMYAHYSTKEALLFELSVCGHNEVQALVSDATECSMAPPEQLRRVVTAYVEWHARSHVTARVVQYEMAALSSDHYAYIAAIRRDIETRVRRIVRRGIRAGYFTVPDPAVTSLAILSLGIDVARWYRDDGKWMPGQLGAHYAQLALRMVGYVAPVGEAHSCPTLSGN